MNGEDVKFQNWFKISEIANDAAMWEMQAKTAGCSKWDSGFIKKITLWWLTQESWRIKLFSIPMKKIEL